MSKYTTEVRFICETLAGYDKSKGYDSIDDIIAKTRGKIFSFKYPIFDEGYRSVLETKILKRYYTREIGFETYGLWKHFLDMRMNEIMPYYNQLYNSQLLQFNPFNDVDYTTKADRNIDHNEKTTGTRTDNLTEKTDSSSSGDGNGENRYSDTPQGGITGLRNDNYLTNATLTKDHSEGKGESTVVNTGTQDNNGTRLFTNTDDYLEHIAGKRSTASYSDLLTQYRKTFLNIDVDVINDLNDLFMGLW